MLVADGRRRVTISSRSPFRVVDERGRWHRVGRRHIVLTRKLLHFRAPLVFVPSTAPLALNGSAYRGNLVVRRSGGALRVVNTLRVEDYLRGVVPWEMPSRWRQAALCAQAVAARTYALATSNTGSTFDLYADTRDQMYGGIRAEKPSTNRAVAATSGRTHVAHSDTFPGLRPGYWIVYRGPYATRDVAARHAAGGYVRRVG